MVVIVMINGYLKDLLLTLCVLNRYNKLSSTQASLLEREREREISFS